MIKIIQNSRFYSRLNNLKSLRTTKVSRIANAPVTQTEAANLQNQKAIIVSRQVEFLNVFLGYEQANKYVVKNESEVTLGFIAEEDTSIKSTILRQIMKTRRQFKADILDAEGKVIYRLFRPVKWFLNSRLDLLSPDGRVLGTILSDWHLIRRRYDIFFRQEQIYRIDVPLLSWDFVIENRESKPICHINRNFGGFIKEIFADAGQYQVLFENGTSTAELRENQALLLATAISIDIDYFSRHSSHSSGGLIPFVGGSAPDSGSIPIPVPIDIGNDTSQQSHDDTESATSSSPQNEENSSENQWGDPIPPDDDFGQDSGSSWTDFFDDD